jgi:hypothetical protein
MAFSTNDLAAATAANAKIDALRAEVLATGVLNHTTATTSPPNTPTSLSGTPAGARATTAIAISWAGAILPYVASATLTQRTPRIPARSFLGPALFVNEYRIHKLFVYAVFKAMKLSSAVDEAAGDMQGWGRAAEYTYPGA